MAPNEGCAAAAGFARRSSRTARSGSGRSRCGHGRDRADACLACAAGPGPEGPGPPGANSSLPDSSSHSSTVRARRSSSGRSSIPRLGRPPPGPAGLGDGELLPPLGRASRPAPGPRPAPSHLSSTGPGPAGCRARSLSSCRPAGLGGGHPGRGLPPPPETGLSQGRTGFPRPARGSHLPVGRLGVSAVSCRQGRPR